MPTLLTSPNASAADASRPHLILVGLPGAGKTTIGERLAERTGRPFLDFDREIERREGASVSDIFGQYGEVYFRQKERELTEELRSYGGMILAPGGGWIENRGVVALLRPPAKIVYLKVNPDVALARLGPATASRPLLSRPDPLSHLEQLLEQRWALYEGAADLVLNTELYGIPTLTDKVWELATGSVGA